MKTIYICMTCGSSLEYCKYCDETFCPECDGDHAAEWHTHDGYTDFHETD